MTLFWVSWLWLTVIVCETENVSLHHVIFHLTQTSMPTREIEVGELFFHQWLLNKCSLNWISLLDFFFFLLQHVKRLPSADVPDLMSPQTNQNLPVQVMSNKNIRLKLKWCDPKAVIVQFKGFPRSWNEIQIWKSIKQIYLKEKENPDGY